MGDVDLMSKVQAQKGEKKGEKEKKEGRKY